MKAGKPSRATAIIANKIALIIGLMALCLGVLVYLTLRSPDQIYFTRFLGIRNPLVEIQSPMMIAMGNRLPAFLHVLAFSLITASFFARSRPAYAVICGGWFLIDSGFELGQKYKDQASRWIFDFFDRLPFLEGTRNYFLHGTFDIFDILAYAAGAATAFLILMATSRHAHTIV